MITVSAKALWWREPELCDCPAPDEEFPCPHDTTGGWPAHMFIGEIDGWQYLTDRYVVLPASRLGGLPVGYGRVMNLQPLTRQALEGFGEWLTATVHPEPSTRLFQVNRVDPLEQAGFRVRPLEGVKDVHAVCGPDLAVVGLVTPIRRRDEQEFDGRAAS